jgi:hypothetical protein
VPKGAKVDIENYLNENAIAATDAVVPVEAHIDQLFGTEGDTTVSQEGFTDVLKSFWLWLSEPGKPGVGAMTGGWTGRRSTIVAALQKTYLNPDWLSKRVLRQGTQLRLDGSHDYIGIDGVIETGDLSAPIEDFLTKLRKVSEAYSQYLRHVDLELQRIMRKVNINDVEDLNLFEVEAVTEALERSQVRLTVDYRTQFGNTHIQRILTMSVDSDKPFAASKLKQYQRPALTVAEITSSAQGIIKMSEALDVLAELRNDFANLKGFKAVDAYMDTLEEYQNDAQDQTIANPSADIDTDAQDRMFDLMKTVYNIPNRTIAFHVRHVDSIIRAYARLIDASVK